ncbi:TraB/GumN family protein [Gilvimarinus sp. SDUM040013]|uniref:TraB/GumN family protein n=1 Tax=Gilvimarinus gilvus TaxID=3058038 RepID=A0ABU4RV95_9GAMM|nr:TraB/GumN family protein [Gilvimarinus sp. SDUM040013]MDO3387849.1 TraB/GumN family protein [Gilvimarinus sp. SDUM040013]MDX6848780.1 TraB/GumN family protein [Gilvimarinus sp. SDUM040013]
MQKIKMGLLAACLSACALLANFASAEAMVWEVSRGDNTVYLAGTIHMLKPSDYPLPAEYEEAFAVSDTIVLETDMEAVQSPQFAMQMSQKMMLPEGQSLSTVLNADVYEQVRAFSSERGLPLQAIANFQPAFIALTLSVLEMQKLGFAEGVDVLYAKKAKEAGKALGALETPEQQLGFIMAMTELDPNEFMLFTLEDMKNLPVLMDDMVKAFKTGDADGLYRLGGEPMIDYSRELYQTILTDRNRAWLTDIEQFLATSDTEMVMVGALHLAGPDSVPALLKQKGISVKRL